MRVLCGAEDKLNTGTKPPLDELIFKSLWGFVFCIAINSYCVTSKRVWWWCHCGGGASVQIYFIISATQTPHMMWAAGSFIDSCFGVWKPSYLLRSIINDEPELMVVELHRKSQNSSICSIKDSSRIKNQNHFHPQTGSGFTQFTANQKEARSSGWTCKHPR